MAHREALESAARAFFQTYEDAAKAKDPTIICRGLAPNCIRYVVPASFYQSLGVPPDFSMSNQMYQEAFAWDSQVWSTESTKIMNLTVDTERRSVAAQTDYSGVLTTGENLSLTFAWFLQFDVDCDKIERIWEFLDTEAALEFESKLVAILGKRPLPSQ